MADLRRRIDILKRQHANPIPRYAFNRVATGMVQEMNPAMDIEAEAVNRLKKKSERYMSKFFLHSRLLATHRKRKTVMLEDVRLLQTILGNYSIPRAHKKLPPFALVPGCHRLYRRRAAQPAALDEETTLDDEERDGESTALDEGAMDELMDDGMSVLSDVIPESHQKKLGRKAIIIEDDEDEDEIITDSNHGPQMKLGPFVRIPGRNRLCRHREAHSTPLDAEEAQSTPLDAEAANLDESVDGGLDGGLSKLLFFADVALQELEKKKFGRKAIIPEDDDE